LTQNTDGGGLASFGDLSVDLAGSSCSTRRVGAWVPSQQHLRHHRGNTASLAYDVSRVPPWRAWRLLRDAAQGHDSFGNAVAGAAVAVVMSGGGTLSGP